MKKSGSKLRKERHRWKRAEEIAGESAKPEIIMKKLMQKFDNLPNDCDICDKFDISNKGRVNLVDAMLANLIFFENVERMSPIKIAFYIQ